MKKNLSTPMIIAGVVAVFFISIVSLALGGCSKSQSSGSANGSLSASVTAILQRTHGDISKMTPEEQKIYNEALKKGQVPAGMPGAPPMPPQRTNPASLP